MTDIDEVHAFFRAVFAEVTVMLSDFGSGGAELRGVGTMLGDVPLHGMRYAARIRVEGVARGLVNVVHVRDGRFSITDRRGVQRVAPGRVALLPAEQMLELEGDAVESFTVGLPTTLVDEVARGWLGGDGGPVRFAGTRPVSAGLERHWLGTLAYVRQVVLADLELATNPLIIAQVRHMLATAALAVFPSAAVVPQQRGPGDVAPSVVRRAMAHVEAHSDRYVSLAELAEAAGVSARGLQYAFRRYQGTTPARYARRVRLDRAHQDLLRGDPAAGDTVAAIAARWGFADAKRFATDYRAAYGQPPSRTLRS
ncbi:helix-turn-helix domain-containing protein [Micromonospora rifamycinica]|uniref:AraC family transcriptional regulator n=1 Tax=Micromonospora rifamycinica TaxID=291594 RepID=UPI002E2E6191|nr:helix-turn-helix domain-containing protein [Micromonospora rifamycinica]